MTFQEAYSSLNTKQRQAVDHINGPLLVIAGPGTGKTQLLSTRAANILQKTDSSPENILCLTFTEKAATNMRERMLQIIGPDARKIVVKTFHSLGAEIINQYPDYFYNAAQLEPAPEAIKLDVLDELLSKLPLDNPLALKFAGQNTLVSDVNKAISKSKDAGLTPDKLAAVISANLVYIDEVEPQLQPLLDQRMSKKLISKYARVVEELPDQNIDIKPIVNFSEVLKTSLRKAVSEAQDLGKATPLSAWKSEWSEVVNGARALKDRRVNNWFLALSEVYKDYQQRMHAGGYFDFSDMILDTIVQLERNETLRADVQERFSYIMIDEFQDTNDAQFRLSNLIAHYSGDEGSSNIMAVGDDDQAIYRFQGAEISNAQNFVSSFEGTETIVLKDNYRSHQSILDASANIAEKIDHRLVNIQSNLDKKIEAKGIAKAGKIEHISYSTKAHEITGVAEQLKEKFSIEKGQFAVLSRNHDSLQQLAYVLHKLNVPVRYERRSNVLEHKTVQLVGKILELLLAISNGQHSEVNTFLRDILAAKEFGIDPSTLWKFAIANTGRSSDWLNAAVNSNDQLVRELGSWLMDLAKESKNQPLSITIEYILGLRDLNGFTSPLKTYLVNDDLTDEYIQTISALQSLRSLAAEFAREQEPSLENFARFMRLNQRHGVVVADESVFVTGNRAVELMTLHKAKGLEFDTVLVVDAVDKVWSPSQTRRKPPKNLESLQDYGEDMDDYGRMMFVAATRAKSNLVFNSFRTNEHGKEVLPSPLIHEVPVTEADESKMNIIEVIENSTNWPELDHGQEKLLLKPLVENYRLSVTHLLNFLNLEKGGPQYFLERNLLRLPDLKSPVLAYGTAIHSSLKLAQQQVNLKKTDINKVLDQFETELKKQQLEKTEEDRYLVQGRKLLTELINEKLQLRAGSVAEREISDVRIGDAVISGNLDRIDTTQKGLTIVDYKTGSPLKSKLTTTSKSAGLKAFKHRTQLIFYALLAQEKGLVKPNQMVTGQMIYVEADSDKDFIRQYTPTDEDLKQMKQLIQAVWKHIQAVDWPDISTYSTDLDGTQKFIDHLLADS